MSPPSTIELSVIAPCLNEELNVPELTRACSASSKGGLEGELVLVDDGSHRRHRARHRAMMDAHPGRVVGVFHSAEPRHRRRAGRAAPRRRAASSSPSSTPTCSTSRRTCCACTRALRVQRRRGAGLAQLGRPREGERYHISRGFNFMLNRAFGMELRDNKSGFVMCAREVIQGSPHLPGQLLLLADVHHGGRARQGLLVQEIETLFEERRAGHELLRREGARRQREGARRPRQGRVGVPRQPAPPDVAHQFLRRHPVADRSRRAIRCALTAVARLHGGFNQTHWMITRDVEHYYETLRKTQWLTPARRGSCRTRSSGAWCATPTATCPTTARACRSCGLRPRGHSRRQEDLHKLPFLTKADITEHLYFDIMSENHDKARSSGSPPAAPRASRSSATRTRQLEFRWAATLRAQEWTGYRFGDPSVRLWHQTIGHDRSPGGQGACRRAALQSHVHPRLRDERTTNLERDDATDRAHGSRCLMDGYAEALDFLAHYLKTTGSADVRPRAIMSSAQTLPEPQPQAHRGGVRLQGLRQVRSREFSGIAYECDAHAGHHVVAEGYIVEIAARRPTRASPARSARS